MCYESSVLTCSPLPDYLGQHSLMLKCVGLASTSSFHDITSCYSPCSWLLYELPGFLGRSVALEEGSIELQNMWAEPEPPGLAMPTTPVKIGSIRLAVRVSESTLGTANFQTQTRTYICNLHTTHSATYFHKSTFWYNMDTCPCKQILIGHGKTMDESS